eukprot:RCo026599
MRASGGSLPQNRREGQGLRRGDRGGGVCPLHCVSAVRSAARGGPQACLPHRAQNAGQPCWADQHARNKRGGWGQDGARAPTPQRVHGKCKGGDGGGGGRGGDGDPLRGGDGRRDTGVFWGRGEDGGVGTHAGVAAATAATTAADPLLGPKRQNGCGCGGSDPLAGGLLLPLLGSRVGQRARIRLVGALRCRATAAKALPNRVQEVHRHGVGALGKRGLRVPPKVQGAQAGASTHGPEQSRGPRGADAVAGQTDVRQGGARPDQQGCLPCSSVPAGVVAQVEVPDGTTPRQSVTDHRNALGAQVVAADVQAEEGAVGLQPSAQSPCSEDSKGVVGEVQACQCSASLEVGGKVACTGRPHAVASHAERASQTVL